jgi:predicted XRE-type DNA-binding protein
MSVPTDVATIRALRSDLALQIARHVQERQESQVTAARRLRMPQPTLSKIMNGNVATLSLELLIRIAVRAELPVVLQTGKAPEEAGAYRSGGSAGTVHGRTTRSELADEARAALTEHARQLTPEERLLAHLKHSELVMALHRAGKRPRKTLKP